MPGTVSPGKQQLRRTESHLGKVCLAIHKENTLGDSLNALN